MAKIDVYITNEPYISSKKYSLTVSTKKWFLETKITKNHARRLLGIGVPQRISDKIKLEPIKPR